MLRYGTATIVSLAAAVLLVGYPGETRARSKAPVEPDVAAGAVTTDSYPTASVGFANKVTGYPGVVFVRPEGFRPLTLDLYVPQGDGGLKPVVVYVHGGGWAGGSPRNAGAFTDFPGVLADLASRGFVVASVSYRFSSEAPFPAAQDDLSDAIRWLKTHATAFGADRTRVGIWGASAGGQMAGLAALNCTPATDGSVDGCVQAAVLWYPLVDMTRGDRWSSAYLRCGPLDCAQRGAEATPLGYVDGRDPPTLLIHGGADSDVPPSDSRRLYEALSAAGVTTRIVELPNIRHRWLGRTPEETRAASVRALSETIDWFEVVLGGRR